MITRRSVCWMTRMLALIMVLALLSACIGPVTNLEVKTENNCANYMNAEW